MQHVTRLVLEALDCHVDIVGSSEAALEVFRDNHQLIPMDIVLPGMNGVRTALHFRLGDDIRKILVSIVAVTACRLADNIAECYHAGMNDVILKPALTVCFRNILATYCGHFAS